MFLHHLECLVAVFHERFRAVFDDSHGIDEFGHLVAVGKVDDGFFVREVFRPAVDDALCVAYGVVSVPPWSPAVDDLLDGAAVVFADIGPYAAHGGSEAVCHVLELAE